MNYLDYVGYKMKTLDDLKREITTALTGRSNNALMTDAIMIVNYLHAQGRIVPDGYVAVSDVVLWAAWRELNAIRARSGVPLGLDGKPQPIAEDYFSKLVDDLHDALGDKAQPWALTNMIAAAQKGEM